MSRSERTPKLKSEVRKSYLLLLLWWAMNHYQHLSKTDRLELSILRRNGYTPAEIAAELGRHISTIYRELKRNIVKGGYVGKKAHQKAYVRRKYATYQAMCIVSDMKLREYIETKLLVDEWSPEQIAGRLAKEVGLPKVSAPTIYKYIRSPYGRQLEYQLELAKKKRTKKHQQKVTALEDRIFIDQRPEAANVRAQYGHWEGDFIVSGKPYGTTSLLVLHERVSRYTFIRKITARTVQEVEDVLAEAIRELGPFKSLTLDNDIAFRRHLELSELIGAPIFFCWPYHSWEKGGVENVNRLIRRYVPKGCDISIYTNEEIARFEHLINGKPRKVLNYQTATELFNEYKVEAKRA